jgi:Ribbon-helix-helix protein, copG family
MACRMKTTLNIDETVMAELKREATRQGRTMSDLVETALRNLFQRQKTSTQVSPLPTFRSGGSFIDIGDREALYQAMEGR